MSSNILRISPTVALRIMPCAPPSPAYPPTNDAPSYSSPKVPRQRHPSHAGQRILTGITNVAHEREVSPPASPMASPLVFFHPFPATPTKSSIPPVHDTSPQYIRSPVVSWFGSTVGQGQWNTTPGPFMLLRHLETGRSGETVVVRELNNRAGCGGAAGRLLCMKVARKENLEDRVFSEALRELAAYKMLALARRVRGRAFVMELDGALEDDKRLYYAMELMRCDLFSVLSGCHPGREEHKRRWIAQIAMGLHAIHEAGIIHRDIKPENILIDCRDNVRIADFGSAYIDKRGSPLHPWGSYAEEVWGTRPYTAPEVMENLRLRPGSKNKYGVGVDYWGLGCLVWELESEHANVLFTSEAQLWRYVGWNNALHGGKSYFSSAGLSRDAETILLGLLRVNAPYRFGIEDLRRQPYFKSEDGKSEFENIETRALRRERADIDPLDEYDESVYPMVFSPGAPPAAYGPHDSDVDVDHLGWINPCGIWGGQ